jgi:hypothetical protein
VTRWVWIRRAFFYGTILAPEEAALAERSLVGWAKEGRRVSVVALEFKFIQQDEIIHIELYDLGEAPTELSSAESAMRDSGGPISPRTVLSGSKNRTLV